MRRLNCAVQNYAWGKRGKDSMVSKLKMLENEGFETDENKTYAELWMGTHPNGPSRVMPEPGDFTEEAEEGHAGIFLIELLETHPHYLGDLQDQGDLPFMFKVLSINKALSIQVTQQKPATRQPVRSYRSSIIAGWLAEFKGGGARWWWRVCRVYIETAVVLNKYIGVMKNV